MPTVTIPSTVPFTVLCEAMRLAGLEPDPKQQRGCLAFRATLPRSTRDPAAAIRAAARRGEVRA